MQALGYRPELTRAERISLAGKPSNHFSTKPARTPFIEDINRNNSLRTPHAPLACWDSIIAITKPATGIQSWDIDPNSRAQNAFP